MAQNFRDSVTTDLHIGAEAEVFTEEDFDTASYCCPPFCGAAIPFRHLS